MKQHPLSSAFPAMSADEFNALKDSITNIGVQDPITLYEGMVIDGWHRYTAANEVGVQCPTAELGDVDPQTFVIAKNKARRHITQSQIAAAVVSVYGWKPAHREKVAPGATLTKTNAELAELAGTSVRTIRQAKAVESKATPAVKEAVKAGVMSVKAAAETVSPPKVEEPEDDGPDADEIAAMEAAVAADAVAMEKLFQADDKLAAAFAEIKRLNAENAQLKSRMTGLMNEKNEAISLCKSVQRKLDKLQKVAA